MPPSGAAIRSATGASFTLRGGSLRLTPAQRRPLPTRRGRRFFHSTVCGSGKQRDMEVKRIIMKRVHCSSIALLLAVTTSAWAGGGLYPRDTDPAGAPGKTRAEVSTELHDAQRLGLMAGVEGRFPGAEVDQGRGSMGDSPADAGKSRGQVRAETDEAGRLGLLSIGEGNPAVASAEQEALIAAAGKRALGQARVEPQVVVVPPVSTADSWSEVR